MDTSETRIKMCEKAEEIQKLAPDAEDSKEWFCCPICHALTLDGYYTGCSHDVDDKLIWLPRQDQFQEILGVKLPANALFAISGWITKMNWLEFQKTSDGLLASSCPYSSMDQLWLAFCMSEKYNKTWDGEKWEVRL